MTEPLAVAPQRRRHRAIWLLVAAVTALAVTGSGAAGAASLLLRHRVDAGPVSFGPVSAVTIDAPGSDITVSPGPPGQVLVHRSLAWALGRQPQIRQSMTGRTLTITTTGCPRKSLFWCSVHLDIRMPAGAALHASVTTGTLNAAGLTGQVHLQASSGEIGLVNMRGRVWAHATSGVISAGALAGLRADTGVTSGSLDLQFAIPPQRVTATATSGVVSVTVPRGARYRVLGGTRSGAWSAQQALVSMTSPRLITLSTTSGSASVGYGPVPPPAPHEPSQPQPAQPKPA